LVFGFLFVLTEGIFFFYFEGVGTSTGREELFATNAVHRDQEERRAMFAETDATKNDEPENEKNDEKIEKNEARDEILVGKESRKKERDEETAPINNRLGSGRKWWFTPKENGKRKTRRKEGGALLRRVFLLEPLSRRVLLW
jgi:hypothetical protein